MVGLVNPDGYLVGYVFIDSIDYVLFQLNRKAR